MKRFDQINVIPFIDIMLVLLAIVLTTATFISQGIIEVDLPAAENSAPLPDEETVEIAITADTQFYFDEAALSLEALADRLEGLDRETPVFLRVDKSVAFEHFVTVIDLLKKYQLERLSIMTRED